MLRKLSSGAEGLRESLRELLEAQEAPQRLPRAPRENPRSVPGGPKEVQNEPQEAPNDPQEGQNEPQEGQSELREVPGGFRERFGEEFLCLLKQRVATETLPAQTAGVGA